jgi:hypothetical protein
MNTTVGTTVVQLSEDARGEPVAIENFHGRIVDQCADAVAMFARQRASLPLASVPETERWIGRQRDAVVSLQADGIGLIAAWWERSMDSADPWKAWAAVFLLGSLGDAASREGIAAALELLEDDDEHRWAAAAEAIALVVPPDSAAFANELLSSSHAATRAVGLDLLARSGALPLDLLKRHFARPDPPVLASAARAATRIGAARDLAPELTRCLAVPNRAVAWEAARALTLARLPVAFLKVGDGGRLASTLGSLGVEILILLGDDMDIGTCETLVAGTPMTASLLSAVARYGSVTTWSFLLHYLAEPELIDATVHALRTLFGDLVPDADVTSVSAWRAAIVEAEFNPALRYRRGKPWHPSTVLAECASGTLSRIEVERRIDELRARVRAEVQVDLGLWEPDAHRQLAAFVDHTRARGVAWRPGAWR